MNEVDIDILVISNSMDFTTDFITLELSQRKRNYLRINRDWFNEYSVALSIDELRLIIIIDGTKYVIAEDQLKSIYYRAPIYLHYVPTKIPNFEEQLYRTQWMAFLRNLVIFEKPLWMNNPIATFKAENKMLQLVYARRNGLQCPSTVVTNDSAISSLNTENFYAVKSIDTVLLREKGKEAFSYTNIISGMDLIQEDLSISPLVIQQNLSPKVDIRVTVIKDKVFSVKILYENSGVNGDWRKYKDDVEFVPFDLPNDIKNACVNLTSELGLAFGGIDLALFDDIYYFIEINPTGEWAWLRKNYGLQIDKAICDYLCEGSLI